jgi:hypothetical protein
MSVSRSAGLVEGGVEVGGGCEVVVPPEEALPGGRSNGGGSRRLRPEPLDCGEEFVSVEPYEGGKLREIITTAIETAVSERVNFSNIAELRLYRFNLWI